MKRIVALLIASLVVCAPPAFASEATHRAAAEEMVRLARVDQLMKSLFDQMKASMNAILNDNARSVEDRVRAGKISDKVFAIMEQEMSWDKMKDDFVDLYMKTYSEDEIRQINAFYKTPAGQAMIEKMPQLMKASTAISQKYTRRMLERMQKEIPELGNGAGGK